MSVEHQQPQTGQPSAFSSLIERAIFVVMIALIAIGLIAATITWRGTTIEFVGNDRLRITQSQWWGLFNKTSIYQAGNNGWVIRLENGEEESVRSQPIKLRN